MLDTLRSLRDGIAAAHAADEAALLERLTATHGPDAAARDAARRTAVALVEAIRGDSRPGLMEVFLAEYGLSTDEGIALMCLAEALLRVPDPATMDDLIEDKIAPSDWSRHLGHSASPLVNASTWALMLTGRVLKEPASPGVAATLRATVKRLGEPVIRTAVQRAMREMGNQFVLGETIGSALERGRRKQAQGYTYSYDMLGEAAMTAADADAFHAAYAGAIRALAAECGSDDIRANPGISVKLSALHPRYETRQRDRVMAELVPRLAELARQARAAGLGLNIDAEEAARLEISLDVIAEVLSDPALAGWDGFGVVVQAYGTRAPAVIDWLAGMAETLDRRLMVRLVKGAYWDTEIKHAQVQGLPGFPVFTRKAATDAAWICCAGQLLARRDRLYPQFATHNAHSAAAVLAMTEDRDGWEFQRLHGMGEALHDLLIARHGARSRIYAPVGAHRDLLAYLVRRLLENGANSSFVNRIVDTRLPPEQVVLDPFDGLQAALARPAPGVVRPADLFAPERTNSAGFDLDDPVVLARLEAARAPFAETRWQAAPMLAAAAAPEPPLEARNPARPGEVVGTVRHAGSADLDAALAAARPWAAEVAARAEALRRAADLYEAAHGELFALLAREAGKTLPDAVAELREAVDFLRYYGARATAAPPRGTFACISPWNFPLAIFTGQVAAALAAGNAVLAKPAETTSLIAARAVALLHEAGVPRDALQLLPGTGRIVGAALAADPRVDGLCFTGSTATAQAINRAMAAGLDPHAPLIAETGGLNAMIVDTTALPEQAVRDILASAFQSAGQRCSALRILYVQKEAAPRLLTMLKGAMDELRLGDPWRPETDIGPIITPEARDALAAHVEAAARDGRLLHRLAAPPEGAFLAPALIRVGGIGDLEREVFGPVLHVAAFDAADLDRVIDDINAAGYGLTFGLHTRIDGRVQEIADRLRIGNVYVNRNQIGAVVGSQPFGGEGLSGTGPKAGGPHYLPRFTGPPATPATQDGTAAPAADPPAVQAALDAAAGGAAGPALRTPLPGPTGETNVLSTVPRGTVLCLGPTAAAAEGQMQAARAAGCAAVGVAPGLSGPGGVAGRLAPEALSSLRGVALVAVEAGPEARALRGALAGRDGPLIPLVDAGALPRMARLERHVCIDTTASGGNASLLAATD